MSNHELNESDVTATGDRIGKLYMPYECAAEMATYLFRQKILEQSEYLARREGCDIIEPRHVGKAVIEIFQDEHGEADKRRQTIIDYARDLR